MLTIAQSLGGAMPLAVFLPCGIADAQPDAASLTRAQFDAMLAWTFLFVGAPLRIQSGTGSPLNPIAVF